MTDNNSGGHVETVEMQDVLDIFVVGNEGAELSYLRSKWIETVMLQMVTARVEAHLSQRELGACIGKPQSSVGRVERSSDVKLSTLFDHFSAAGFVPVGEIPCESVQSQRKALGNHARSYSEMIRSRSASVEGPRALALGWKECRDNGIDLSKVAQPKQRYAETKEVKAAAA